MRNLKQEETQLVEVMSKLQELKYNTDKKERREYLRLKKRLPLIKSTILYLKGNPTDEYCKEAKAKIERKIEILMSRYVKPVNYERLTKPQTAKHLKSYKKEEGILKMEQQLSNLDYILGI